MLIDIRQLEFIDKTLREILMAIEEHFGVQLTITSLFRINDKGVHGSLPLRGTDLSCPNRQLGYVVEHWVNTKYEYDHTRPDKKCCLYHKTPNGAWHLHLQSHPNTRLH